MPKRLDHNEQNTAKVIYDRLWDQIAVKINECGPPIRNSYGWRRVWSTYKYNLKRRQPVAETTGRHQSNCNLSNVSPVLPLSASPSGPPADQVPVAVQVLDSQPSMSLQILEKLDQILTVLVDSKEILNKIAGNTPQ